MRNGIAYYNETPRNIMTKMSMIGDLDADPAMSSWVAALRALFDAGYADEPCLYRIDWTPITLNGEPANAIGLEFPDNPRAQAVYDSVAPLEALR